VAHRECDVPRRSVPWHITDVMCWGVWGLAHYMGRARADHTPIPKIFPPTSLGQFFLWLFIKLFVPPNSIRGMSGFYVQDMNQKN
jgi:hypothetical protein